MILKDNYGRKGQESQKECLSVLSIVISMDLKRYFQGFLNGGSHKDKT